MIGNLWAPCDSYKGIYAALDKIWINSEVQNQQNIYDEQTRLAYTKHVTYQLVTIALVTRSKWNNDSRFKLHIISCLDGSSTSQWRFANKALCLLNSMVWSAVGIASQSSIKIASYQEENSLTPPWGFIEQNSQWWIHKKKIKLLVTLKINPPIFAHLTRNIEFPQFNIPDLVCFSRLTWNVSGRFPLW